MRLQHRICALVMAFLVCLMLAPLASPVWAQQPAGTVSTTLANVRSGPGTNYAIIGQVPQGTVLTLTGRNAAGDWFQVCCVRAVPGWIYAPLVVVEGSTAGLPVIQVPPPSPPSPPSSFSGWRGEYFNNRDLQGAPVYVRDDPSINFRWNGGSPAPGVPGSNFSARWTRTLSFPAGNYTFNAQVDDGVRLWVDNLLVLDDWRENSMRTVSNVLNALGAGNHTIRVEYFQAGGNSGITVWWDQAGQFPDWKGEYFNDIYLQGPPLLVRNDVQVNFNWGLDSPDPKVPADNFSVRWTRRLNFEAGDYIFQARTSDGVRIYLDNILVLNEWRDTEGYPTYASRFNNLGAGPHTVTVEYYERGGIAYAEVWWGKAASGDHIPQ